MVPIVRFINNVRKHPLSICSLNKVNHFCLQVQGNMNAQSEVIRELRKPYAGDNCAFLEENLPSKDPLIIFEKWFQEVLNTPSIREPNAMAVASTDGKGNPSVRMVLLKHYDSTGFCFYTNYESRKGQELTENKKAALLFFWESLSRQVRIEGDVKKVPNELSEEYFSKRPKKSQISSAISPQSKVISKNLLDDRYNEELAKYESSPVPRPSFWGGFRVIPKYFEFWQGTTNRLHDRIIFRKPKEDEIPDEQLVHTADNGWLFERLGP